MRSHSRYLVWQIGGIPILWWLGLYIGLLDLPMAMDFWCSVWSNSTTLRLILRQLLFVLSAFFDNLHTSEPGLCYSLWYPVTEVKDNIFLYGDFNISPMPHLAAIKLLLKLINFKSFNSRVTWSRFKYFPLLATFRQSWYIFNCNSYLIFSLLLLHIEQQ